MPLELPENEAVSEPHDAKDSPAADDAAPRSAILYNITLREGTKKKEFYSEISPFDPHEDDYDALRKGMAIEIFVEARKKSSPNKWSVKEIGGDSDSDTSITSSPMPTQPGLSSESGGDGSGAISGSSSKIVKMHVHSPHLKSLLKELVTYYPEQVLEGDWIVIYTPFRVLVHHYHDLLALSAGGSVSDAKIDSRAREILRDPRASQDLKVLVDYLKPDYTKTIKAAEIRHSAGVFGFKALWLLFKPGCDVYGKVGGQLAGYVVSSTEEKSSWDADKRVYIKYCFVTCWNLKYKNGKIVRTNQVFKINEFHGEKEITSLAVFPSQYLDSSPADAGKTRKSLEERGIEYYSICKQIPLHIRYKGLTWERRGQSPRTWNKEPKLLYEGDVIIDPQAYLIHSSGAVPYRPSRSRYDSDDDTDDEDKDPRATSSDESRWKDYDDINPKLRDTLTAHQNFLFPRRIDGFTLKEKKWRGFDVQSFLPLKWSPEDNSAMSRLILPHRDIEILKALSPKYSDSDIPSWSADFIVGKGEGQVFLLHGSPGTGKTYTVECVADYTRRPLLGLTVADIGTDQIQMEDRLSRWFSVAASWDAVLLIDEADVFLEKRSFSNLARNGLVSVFLRCMEYYKGMLFLTTNRIGHIDDAFLSRISVALTYENLDPGTQRQIWDGFLAKLERERKGTIVTDRARDYLATDPDVKKIPWNGREIRNTVQTALGLARHDAEKDSKRFGNSSAKLEVDKEHFDKVVQRRKALIEYRDRINRGATEEQRALIEGSRAPPKKI